MASSDSLRSLVTYGRKRSPPGVSLTPSRLRSKSGARTTASSFLICEVTADCEYPRIAAAFVMLPV